MHPAKNGIATSMDALPTETQQILFNTPYLHKDISYHLSFVDNYLDAPRVKLSLSDDATAIKNAIEVLINERQHTCIVHEPDNQQFYDLDTFEEQAPDAVLNTNDRWNSRNGRRPVR